MSESSNTKLIITIVCICLGVVLIPIVLIVGFYLFVFYAIIYEEPEENREIVVEMKTLDPPEVESVSDIKIEKYDGPEREPVREIRSQESME